MRGQIHKAILLPSICCLAFYGGAQLVGETEAAFSSQVSPDSITMSTAFVFPSAIQQLKDRAQIAAKSMKHNYKKVNTASPGASTEELHEKLAEVTAIEKELTLQLRALRGMHDELSAYNIEIQNQGVTDAQTFDYIREGFQYVDRILKDVQATIDFSYIEGIRSSVQLQIEDAEGKEESSIEQVPANNQKPTNDQTRTNLEENAELQDAASTNATTDKQVTMDEEETLENSE